MDTTEDSVHSPAGPSTPKDVPVTSANDKDTGKGKDFKEDPYNYLPDNHPLLKTCLERLQIIPSFPSQNVLVRNTLTDSNSIRSFYISNDLVKAVITNNDYQKLRLTAAGTKVFTKQEAGKGLEAQYRVLGEGLPVVLPFVKPEAVLKGSLATLKTFLESYYPLVRTFEEEFRNQIDESCTYLHHPTVLEY
jgi:multisite-specific tRNA:(cytosine-C5)-methyltransferase